MSDDLKFTVQRPPAYGELTDVLPGLFWVRLPMPTMPNHVNCWLLDDGPGWTLVDCGLNTDDTFEIWDKLWRGLLRARPLQNLTFTHAHLDHFGLAGYLVKEMKCTVRLPLAEWHLLRLYNPKLVEKKSVMPPYRFLFEKRKIGREPSPNALRLTGEFAPERDCEIVPTDQAKALAAYLISLRADAVIFETPMTVAVAASTNAPAVSTNAPVAAATNAPAK